LRSAERMGVGYQVLHDRWGAVAGPYRISTLPTTVVVDAAGNIRHTHIGAVSKRGLEHLVFE
jgi:hypothetical protein